MGLPQLVTRWQGPKCGSASAERTAGISSAASSNGSMTTQTASAARKSTDALQRRGGVRQLEVHQLVGVQEGWSASAGQLMARLMLLYDGMAFTLGSRVLRSRVLRSHVLRSHLLWSHVVRSRVFGSHAATPREIEDGGHRWPDLG